MDLKLDDKVVLVSGGGAGIGRGIVEAFAAEGATPVILARSTAAAEETRDSILSKGLKCDFLQVELTEPGQIQTAVETVLRKYRRLDVVVNNAGVNDAVGLKHSPQDFVNSLQKNLVHYFSLVHYAVPALIEAKGSILNVGSKTGTSGQGGTSGYAAASAGIIGLTREWALDLAQQGVRANCIVPAECMTPLYERWINNTPDPELTLSRINATIPLGQRMTTIEELAATSVFLSSPLSSHTTGQIIYVDGGYVHLDRAYTMDTPHLKTSFQA